GLRLQRGRLLSRSDRGRRRRARLAATGIPSLPRVSVAEHRAFPSSRGRRGGPARRLDAAVGGVVGRTVARGRRIRPGRPLRTRADLLRGAGCLAAAPVAHGAGTGRRVRARVRGRAGGEASSRPLPLRRRLRRLRPGLPRHIRERSWPARGARADPLPPPRRRWHGVGADPPARSRGGAAAGHDPRPQRIQRRGGGGSVRNRRLRHRHSPRRPPAHGGGHSADRRRRGRLGPGRGGTRGCGRGQPRRGATGARGRCRRRPVFCERRAPELGAHALAPRLAARRDARGGNDGRCGADGRRRVPRGRLYGRPERPQRCTQRPDSCAQRLAVRLRRPDRPLAGRRRRLRRGAPAGRRRRHLRDPEPARALAVRGPRRPLPAARDAGRARSPRRGAAGRGAGRRVRGVDRRCARPAAWPLRGGPRRRSDLDGPCRHRLGLGDARGDTAGVRPVRSCARRPRARTGRDAGAESRWPGRCTSRLAARTRGPGRRGGGPSRPDHGGGGDRNLRASARAQRRRRPHRRLRRRSTRLAVTGLAAPRAARRGRSLRALARPPGDRLRTPCEHRASHRRPFRSRSTRSGEPRLRGERPPCPARRPSRWRAL
ncbi:MAG: hypothetical protein AVDCRST_MAG17-1714, partial [uncultured Solirubrobacterales bacterium]